jgi:hypothetical protein
MKTILQAKSSSGGSYDVEFQVVDNSVRVFCHCQAGVLQQMCKHKLALINGDASMLFDARQSEDLAATRAWPEFSDLKARTGDYESKLKQIEAAKRQIAKEEKEIKAAFSKGLLHGF